MSMTKYLNRTTILHAMIVTVTFVAIVAVASQVGKSMKQLPRFDRIGIYILSD